MSPRIYPRLLLALGFVFLLLSACAAPALTPAATPSHEESASETEAIAVEPGVLAVTGAFARPSPMVEGAGGAYLTVLNGLDQPLQLTGIESSVAASAELHETIDDAGVMRMIPHPEGFPVPAMGVLELKPGGKHIMLLDLIEPLVAGETITLMLTFDNAAPLVIDVPIRESSEMAAAPPPMPAHAELAPDGPTLADVQNGGLHGWLASTPQPPARGDATIDAYLVTDDGQPVEDATITFDIDMTNMSHGKYLAPATATGGGHYAGNVHFSMGGPWRLIAIVERPGQESVNLRFEFNVDR
jgi:copper(I)-binding protein